MRLQITILTSAHFQELKQLSDELRSDIIYHVSKTGGHLGSSLGMAEVTVALHCVFNAFLRTRYSGMLATRNAVGRDLTGRKNNVIAVTRDGAMTAGQSHEAMSNGGYQDSDMIVILNDNKQVSLPTAKLVLYTLFTDF